MHSHLHAFDVGIGSLRYIHVHRAQFQKMTFPFSQKLMLFEMSRRVPNFDLRRYPPGFRFASVFCVPKTCSIASARNWKDSAPRKPLTCANRTPAQRGWELLLAFRTRRRAPVFNKVFGKEFVDEAKGM